MARHYDLAHRDGKILRHLQCASEHIGYELDMLIATGVRLRASIDCEALRYALLESFLAHYRNLRGFLAPNLDGVITDDDVLAFDYDAGWSLTLKQWPASIDGEKEKIDKQLSHISYSRSKVNWPTDRMLKTVQERFSQFFRGLPPQVQKELRQASVAIRDGFLV